MTSSFSSTQCRLVQIAADLVPHCRHLQKSADDLRKPAESVFTGGDSLITAFIDDDK